MCFYRPNCPRGTFPYTIMAGDTLYSIAMRYNTNVNEILRANPRINPYCLRIGQIICVPMPPMPRPCPAGTFPYDIEPGDTFYSIGRKFNVSVADLMEANPRVNPNKLRVGQRICVPEVVTVPPSGCPAGTFSYTIRSGDTFYRLSQLYNTTVEAIQAANPTVDPDNLRIGQVICIPEATTPGCPSGTFSYTIRSGDTFYSLARRYNTTVEAIQAANPNVNPNNLQIGQQICIPEATTPSCPSGTFSYTIRSGDTFYSLARRYNTTVEAIQAANPNVNPDNLQIGQRICIPEATTPSCPSGTFSYTIRSGDTFYTLARRYNTTVEAIQAANPNVNPDNLQIGQQICIPEATTPSCPSGTFSYTIRSGDTFYTLARRYNTTVEAIQAANPNVNPDNLQIGQQICIPRT